MHVAAWVLLAAGAAVAHLLARAFDPVSALVAAVLLGVVLVNSGLVPPELRRAVRHPAHHLLRLGIVLLGFRLAASEVLALGGRGLVVVLAVVALSFAGTCWLGHRLGLSPALSLLVAAGFSICGASAVAAVDGVIGAEDEEVAFSIALVTLCGSLAIVVLPLAGGLVGLEGPPFGSWAGASVHDVAQVVATASTAGPEALQAAVVVKLTRVVLLAPLVAGIALHQRRRSRRPPGEAGAARPPLVPLFVAGFLGAAVVRSLGVLPSGWLGGLETASTWSLAAALVGLGLGVRLSELRRIGGRPLVLGLAAWACIAVLAYGGVQLLDL